MNKYPFGQPVRPVRCHSSRKNDVFVLGAYPSALHIKWSPRETSHIRALPIDNEPMPFWTGEDRFERVEQWLHTVKWKEEWGTAQAANGEYNGSSGRILRDKVLFPLNLSVERAWITDCLNSYFMSVGVEARLQGDIGAVLEQLGHAAEGMFSHPSENRIVELACKEHLGRLTNELEISKAPLVITLGNAALRVFAKMVGHQQVQKLTSDYSTYGKPIPIVTSGREITWYPLCHPGLRNVSYLQAHKNWMNKVMSNSWAQHVEIDS